MKIEFLNGYLHFCKTVLSEETAKSIKSTRVQFLMTILFPFFENFMKKQKQVFRSQPPGERFFLCQKNR